MAYQKQNWNNNIWALGQDKMQSMLNHMEEGIANAGEGGGGGDITPASVTTSSVTVPNFSNIVSTGTSASLNDTRITLQQALDDKQDKLPTYQANKYLKVNSAGTDLEWAEGGGGGAAVWGEIEGNLAEQDDLVMVLDQKLDAPMAVLLYIESAVEDGNWHAGGNISEEEREILDISILNYIVLNDAPRLKFGIVDTNYMYYTGSDTTKNYYVRIPRESGLGWQYMIQSRVENLELTGSFSINRKEGSIIGSRSVTYGLGCLATGTNSLAGGWNTESMGEASVASGQKTVATGDYSKAEGTSTTACGLHAHAEGAGLIEKKTVVSLTDKVLTLSNTSHKIEPGDILRHTDGSYYGFYTVESVSGVTVTLYSTPSYSDINNWYLIKGVAAGIDTHSEGYFTTARGDYSHAEGVITNACARSQHVFGEFNILDSSMSSDPRNRGTYVEIVGNGSMSARSNARTLDWSGNEWLAGTLEATGLKSGTNTASMTNVIAAAGMALPDDKVAGTYQLRATKDSDGNITYNWISA